MEVRLRLRDEFNRRSTRNPRYSMRAFARDLGLHHSTLVRVLAGTRGLSRDKIRRLANPLSLDRTAIRELNLEEDARRVLDVARSNGFRPDCRWIAMRAGLEIDDVNRALHRLIHQRRLEMISPTLWKVAQS
jgi:hypothetical protein